MDSAGRDVEPPRRGGLWDAVDDIEHVAGQTEPATVAENPPAPPTAPPPARPSPPTVRPSPPTVRPSPPTVRPSPTLPPWVRPAPAPPRAAPPPTAPPWTAPPPTGSSAGRSRRPAVPYVVAGVALLLLAVAVVVVVATDRSTGPVTLPMPSGLTTPGDPGSFGGTPPAQPPPSGPSGAATRPPATPDPSGSTGPSAGPDPSGPVSPVPVRLVARYATIERGALGLGGYTGQVSITNPGDVLVLGWQLILTLPSGATVDDASGARAAQSGRTVTFTPTDATRDVGGGASVEFTFTVSGLLAGQPTGCAIDGHPCS